MFQRFEMRHAASPGAELGPAVIVLEFFPEQFGGLLEHLFGVVGPPEQRQQIAVQPLGAAAVERGKFIAPSGACGGRRLIHEQVPGL